MNILATQYTLQNKSLDIYLSGCKGINGIHCVGCHNPESWSFNQGEEYSQEYFNLLKIKITDFNNLIDNVFIFGGEPLDQDVNMLIHLLFDLKSLNKKIWLFTRYELNQIPKEILQLCDYIKCGKYDENLKTNKNIQYNIKLATSNQSIHKLR